MQYSAIQFTSYSANQNPKTLYIVQIMVDHSIKYITIQPNTLQYNTIQYNKLQCTTIHLISRDLPELVK